MKQKIVGSYYMGMTQVQIVLREGTGGEFYLNPERGHIPRIKIGADQPNWGDVIAILLHEATEMLMTCSHCRYAPAPDYANDHAGYLFVMNHCMFSDVTARVGELLALSLPDLSRAWTKWKKPKRTRTSHPKRKTRK